VRAGSGFDATSLRFEELVVDCAGVAREPATGGAGALLGRLVREHVDRWPGVVVARGLGVTMAPSPAARFAALCRAVGELYPQHPDAPDVREVRDRGTRLAEGATARYSDSRFGGSLHTDGAESAHPLPSRFALVCIRPAARGGDLQLVSAATLHRRLAERSRSAVATLHDPFHFDRRGVPGPRREATVVKPVFWHEDSRLCVTYLRGYIDRGHEQLAAPPLDAAQVAALDLMDALLDEPDLVVAGRLRPDDLVVVDNRSILHGRTTFEDDPGDDGRLLLRAWLR
jgi:alpha-ketoglutarate-dependent taurine dioxygenase